MLSLLISENKYQMWSSFNFRKFINSLCLYLSYLKIQFNEHIEHNTVNCLQRYNLLKTPLKYPLVSWQYSVISVNIRVNFLFHDVPNALSDIILL